MKKFMLFITLIVLVLMACRPEADTSVGAAAQDEPATQVVVAAGSASETTTAPAAETEAVAQSTAAEPPAAAPTDTPTPRPTPSGPFPPVVVNTAPERGQEQPLDAPVELTFSQPMDRASVERAFAIEPGASVDGSFTWVDDQTVRFAFNDGFQRGERYRLRVVESAQSQTGLQLTRPFEMHFSAVGYLAVTQVQPADGVGEVLPDTTVLVMFNRPVVPLGAIEQAGSLPDPLTFVPPVSGEGAWLNTATYQFTPEGDFEPATQYTARVAQGLTDVSGSAVLEDDFEWTFTTVSPAVVASIPAAGDIYVSPTPVISVAFNQVMDHASVQQNLTVVETATGGSVLGRFQWQATGLMPPQGEPSSEFGYPQGESLTEPEPVGVETVSFTPLAPLSPGATYEIILPAGVESQAGSESQKEYRASFTVSPPLAVTGSNPSDGEQFAEMWQGLEVNFNAPLDPASVRLGQTLIISPQVARTDVYTYFSNNDTMLGVNFPRQPNRAYTVTLRSEIESRYGQPLGQDAVIRWQTLRQSPYVYLVSPKIGVYNGYQPQTYIYMTVRNVTQVDFSLYRLPVQDFERLSPQSYRGFERGYEWERYNPQSSNLVGQWQQTVGPEAFENTVYKVDVSQEIFEGEPLPPGIYYLVASAAPDNFLPEARGSDPGEAIDRQILIVSKRNLTIKQGKGDILAWLTDLQSGQPVSDVALSFTGPDGQAQAGVTDAEGLAAFEFALNPNTSFPNLIMFSGDPDQPDDDFAVGSNQWSAGIETYDFSYLYEGGSLTYSRPYGGLIYTERRLYRPGQTVYFKGIVRKDNDASYQIPAGQQVRVSIADARYRQVFSATLPLNEFGTFNGSFPLDDEATLGSYQIDASLSDPVWDSVGVGYNSFNVAEYRKPEFLVEAATDKAEYRAGETITLTVDASFFSGGPVANAPVRWTLLSDDYYFNYQGEGYYDFTNESSSRSSDFNPNFGFGFGQQIGSGEGVTDGNGRFTLSAPADLTGRLTSQTFTFDVAVTGLNNQEVAAQARAVVHKGNFYVGLRSVSYVGQIGQPNEVEALLVDWDSQPVAGQPVDIVVAREEWYSAQQLDPEASRRSADPQYYWTNLVDNVAIFSTTVTTDPDGKATFEFIPDDGGSFRIYARAIDQNDQAVFASIFIWASGYQYVNWGQEDHDRIELVADKNVYSRGETASILVPHPYSGTVTALVTLERGQIYDSFVTELQTNSDQLEIPITAEMSPNIYVSVVVMKGMEAITAAGSVPPPEALPGFKMGYARLSIDPEEKLLNISLRPEPPANNADYYAPGETVTYNVTVTDFEGQPVEAELSLALIDKAVLTLAPDIPGQLEAAFWQRRALDVRTGIGLTLSLDRINRALDERKGGGGGPGEGGPESVRQNFADTALWLPTFTTDANGEGRFEADLPDNLTTWVLLAKGVSGDETLVGEARSEIVTSKPLLARPVTPRFTVVGDEIRMGLIVQNNTAGALTVTPAFTAAGLTIHEMRLPGGDWLALDAAGSLAVAGREEAKVEYRVTVPDAPEAQLTMGVTAAEADLSDAIAFSLPVYRLNTPETVATVGVMPEDGTRLEGIVLPGRYDPDFGGLTVNIEPSLAAGIQAGLTYLEHFPYECVEQTVSRFLPNIFTARATDKLGMTQPDLAAQLERQVNIGLQKLYAQQNTDGGWGWWAGEGSDPNLSAYVTMGLVEARRAGYLVEDWVLDNAVSYLQGSLVAPQDIAAPWQGNRQAFILYVLAEAGQSDLSRMVTLFDQRQTLDYFGRAFLAMGMHLADPDAAQIDTLINDLTSGAVASATGSHWEEAQVDAYAMNTDVRSTAIIIAALTRIQPDHALLPEAVRWLMTVREQGGYWTTTQETAWSIIGLSDWLAVSGDLQANYGWQASLNGAALGSGQANAANLTETTELRVEITELIAGAVNQLAIERDSTGGDEDAGNLYYGAYLTYAKPVNEVTALERGLTVQRQYSLLPSAPSPSAEGRDEALEPITAASVGDFVQVKLTLIAPTDLHYVQVEDYFPAGVEAVDSSLATTSLVGQPPQLARDGGRQPWGWWYFTHSELRDEKAVLFATYLPQGVYEYTYTVRAATPGEYRVIPTHAEQMYFPEVFGRSDGGLFRVEQ